MLLRCIFHAVIFLAGIFLVTAGFLPAAAAQSLEELQTLRLFYKDKDLVVSASRNPKSVSQVAENITVITARQIEEMNAHTVAEALTRVPGLFVSFNRDFGATSLISMQGSEQRHVLVLLDGIPWNFLSEGSAETNTIPVGIITRIEIIKGPASSAWGSSLGGVVNILTKPAGDTSQPTGSIRASAGERNTRDASVQTAGLAGPLGYYLFAGRQESDGLRDARRFDSSSLFSRFGLALSEDADLGLTAGFSKSRNKLGDYRSSDIASSSDLRSFFTALSLDAALTPELDLSLSLYTVAQKFDQNTDTLGLGMISSSPETYSGNITDERTYGARGKLVWAAGVHTAVAGIDVDNGRLDQTLEAGPFLQSYGVAPSTATTPTIDKWALWANDTIALDRWTLIPGFRYDHNSISGSFASPSLGGTFRLRDDTLIRASVARGFTLPPLAWTAAGGVFLDPNPSLGPERTWSYQAGFESTAAPYLWLKGTVFYHDLENELVRKYAAAGPPSYNDLVVNQGRSWRRGLELEAETVPWHDLAATAALACVTIHSANAAEARDRYTGHVALKYDDGTSLVQLSGRYVWWDLSADYEAAYSDWVWDLNLSRQVLKTKQYGARLFITAHNLLDGDQYTQGDSKNPRRWLEAGTGISF